MNDLISFDDSFFIAGSSGMVGSSIYRKLKESGYGLDKNGGKIFSPNRNELNLSDNYQVNKWFEKNKPTVVIMTAAKVGGIFANQTQQGDFILQNLKIQTNVIDSSWKNGVRRLLFLGSSCIYPKFAEQPIREEYLLNGLLEKSNEAYAIAKIAGLKLCESLRNQYGFDAISLMPSNLYGPNDNYHPENSHVMASLIRKFYTAVKNSHNEVLCWGSGKPMREFLHVDDLSSAALLVLEKWFPKSDNAKNEFLPYLNVGFGSDISIFDLAKKIAYHSGFKGKILWDKSRLDGTPRKLLDISRIKSLGWEPKIDLDCGISKTLKDFSMNHF